MVLRLLQFSRQALCVFSCRSCLQQQAGVALCSTGRQKWHCYGQGLVAATPWHVSCNFL